jgi:hypothetical protein
VTLTPIHRSGIAPPLHNWLLDRPEVYLLPLPVRLFLGAGLSNSALIGIGIDHQAAVKRLVEAGTEWCKTCGRVAC